MRLRPPQSAKLFKEGLVGWVITSRCINVCIISIAVDDDDYENGDDDDDDDDDEKGYG